MEDDEVTAKVMTKSSYEFVVPNYRFCRDGSAVGQVIKSPLFMVGGCPFRIFFYPQGKNEAANSGGWVSMFFMNESPKPVECVYELCILGQFERYPRTTINAGFSYEDRNRFREVVIVKPHHLEGNFRFVKRDLIEDPNRFYVVEDCIKIRVIIGVFVDVPFGKLSQQFDPYIFFRLDSGNRYFAEESAFLRTRCSHLLQQYRHNSDILISDMKRTTFEAVLWFIYNDKLHEYDREAISKSEPSDLNSFASSLLAAADRLNMTHLRRQCESILSGNIEEHGMWYTIKSNFGNIWSCACSLLDSSTKMKNA